MKIKRWHGLAAWAFFSLLAIAFIQDSAYLGLGIAVCGGLAFGVLNWYAAR